MSEEQKKPYYMDSLYSETLLFLLALEKASFSSQPLKKNYAEK